MMKRSGQTALEYMLMIVVVLSVLAMVLSMTQYIETLGASLSETIDNTRTQIITWILT